MTMPARLRSLRRVTHLIIPVSLVVTLGACAPAVSLLAGMIGGGGPEKAQLAGPFGGAPSMVQNSPPVGSLASEALSRIEQQPTPACEAQLPPPDASAATACPIRLVCLPGSLSPIRLRVCSNQSIGFEPAKGGTGDKWSWSDGAERPENAPASDDRTGRQGPT
jgi:hypothetical protein